MKTSSGPRRIPLLWILVPMMLGIASAQLLSSLPLRTLLVSAMVAGLCAAVWADRRAARWAVAVALTAFLLGGARMRMEQPSPIPQLEWAPREAQLSLSFERLFNTSDEGRFAGIGRIEAAPVYFESFVGQRVSFSVYLEGGAWQPIEGERYSCFGVFRPLARAGQAELEGFERYLAKQQVVAKLTQGSLLERESRARPFAYRLEAARQVLSGILERNVLPASELTGAYKALMLGQKQELSPEQKELFLRNGTMHLFAISGLHIGVIAACIHHLLSLVRLPRASRPPITLLAILAFVLATGGSASSWRALLMIACLYLCHAARRQVSPLNALALSALIYLLALPLQLFQAGFQMSYLTVAAILLFGLPLASALNRAFPLFEGVPPAFRSRPRRAAIKCREWFFGAFAISLAAFTTSGLMGAYYFQVVPTYGVPINLVAMPLASLAIIAGFVSIILAAIPIAGLSVVFNNAAILLIALIHEFLSLIGRLPASSIATAQVSSSLMIGCLGAVLILACVAYVQSGRRWGAAWLGAPPLATAVALLLILLR